MGHDIEDINDERNYFRNDERLLRIAFKLLERPVVNECKDKDIVMDKSHIAMNNVTNSTINIKLPTQELDIHMQVSQREPHSNTAIQFERVTGTYYCTPNLSEFDPTVNILTTYAERYNKKIEKNFKDKKKDQQDGSLLAGSEETQDT